MDGARSLSRVGGPRLALLLGSGASVTILLGFLIQWVTLTGLGPGVATDSLFAALAVPQVMILVVSNPIAHVLVPLLATEGPDALHRDTWTLFTLAVLGFGGLAVVLAATASLWVPVTAAGFSAEGKALAVRLARIQLGGMALMGTAAVVRSAYHARHSFLWAAVTAVLAAGVGLGYLVWRLPHDGVDAAAWSYTLRAGVEFGLLLPVLGRWQRPRWRSAFLSQFWRRIRPLILGYGYERTELVLDRFLASLAPPGGLSLLYLGQQVWGAVGQVVNRAVAIPVTPRLAQLVGRGDWAGFRGLYRRRLLWVLAITAACLVGLALLGRPALGFVFGIRQVTDADVRLLWMLMLLLVGLLVGDPTGHLLLTSFYAAGDTLTPTRIGMGVYTVGVLLKLAGFFWFGLFGLAAATSVYYLLRSTAFWLALRRMAPPAANEG